MKHKKLWRRMKIAAIFCLALTVLSAIAFFAIQRYIDGVARGYLVTPDTAPQADAVMVLGAFVSESGRPSLVLRDRLDYGYELYAAGKARKILVSGDHGQTDYDEVNAMKDYLVEKGVPREDIFMDHAGFNTYDSMYRAAAIFGIETLLISTQEFHMGRSIYLARRLGIDAYGYASTNNTLPNMTAQNVRESLSRVKAFLDTEILHRAPKYLGPAIPIMGDGSATDG